MDTSQTLSSSAQPAFSDRMRHSKALIAIVAVLGVTVMALAAALVVNRSEAQQGVPVAVAQTAPVAVAAPAAPKVANAAVKPAASTTYNRPAPTVVARADICGTCGTVEAVTPVKRQGQVNGVAVGNTTIGIGTVAGGVLGGLLGNQVGGGNGKTAMTVLGAAGGAYAGNQVEQNMKSVTVYDVRVRMHDGSARHMEVSSPVAVGAAVTVEGKNLRLANAAG